MKQRHTHIIVRLSKTDDFNDTFDLKFKLEEHHFIDKWVDRFKHAQQRQDPISEPWAFYNLNQQFTDEYIINEINTLVNFCNNCVPNLFDRTIDNIKDQDTLNYLHSVFELHHGKLDTWQHNPLFQNNYGNQLRHALSQINQLIHRAESHNKNKYIRVVWFDLPKTQCFTNDDYNLFTNQIDFGGLYTLYADVGKNLESLTTDNDSYVHDFVPNLHYSADFKINFKLVNKDQADEFRRRCKDFYFKNQDYFVNKGYMWKDPRLSTGAIKLAQLIDYDNEIQLLEKISHYNNIQAVYLI